MSKNTSCCEDVTVTIDCTNAKDGSAYPNNVPKPPNDCKQVNTGPRQEGDKESEFIRYYKTRPLPTYKAQAIAHSLGLDYADVMNMDGKAIHAVVERTRKLGTKIEYHHIFPDWAGGENKGDNLVPILRTLHKGDGSAHRWWTRKLEDEKNTIQNKIDQCLEENKETKGFKHDTGESGMKKTAKYLDSKGIGFVLCLKNCSN